PASPEGPLALPGTYTLRLTVDGKPYTSTVTVRSDPRVSATPADLVAQHAQILQLYAGAQRAYDDRAKAVALKNAIAKVATESAPRHHPHHAPRGFASHHRQPPHLLEHHVIGSVAQRVVVEHHHRAPMNDLGDECCAIVALL